MRVIAVDTISDNHKLKPIQS